MRETNFTLGPIQKSLYLLLLYQFTFTNKPKSDISGALGPGPIHYITLKTFVMALGDGTKYKTCFGGHIMILQFFPFFSPAPFPNIHKMRHNLT